MGRWFYEVDTEVTFEQKTYLSGSKFETDDACEMQRFLAAYRKQALRDPREKMPGAIGQLDKECPPGSAGSGGVTNQHDQPT